MITKQIFGPSIHWLHLETPTQEDIDHLMDHYQLPRDFIKSGLDPYEMPRTDTYQTPDGRDYALFVFLIPFIDADSSLTKTYQVFPLATILNEEVIITISSRPVPQLENVIYQDWDEEYDEYSFLLTIFWNVSQSYIRIITQIDSRIQELEQQIARTTQNRINYELIGINKGLVYYATAIHGNRKIMSRLEHTAHKWSNSSVQMDLLRRAQIEHQQADEMIDQAQQIVEVLTDLMNNVINNNMNKIMKFLTIWSIIINVPMLISGLWGMNVDLPFDDNPYALVYIGMITIILSLFVYWLLNNRGLGD